MDLSVSRFLMSAMAAFISVNRQWMRSVMENLDDVRTNGPGHLWFQAAPHEHIGRNAKLIADDVRNSNEVEQRKFYVRSNID